MENRDITNKHNKEIPYKHLVSIIVPTYRRYDSLKRVLVSLSMQTYENIEIILVDDNADEGWNQKVEKIIDQVRTVINCKIIYVQNEKNLGSAESRNKGISISSGTYVTFLDDDDIYLPNKVKNQVEHMIDKKSDFSITDLYLYDKNNKLIEKRIRRYIKSYRNEDLLKYNLMYHMTGTDTMMFKKDFLKKIGGFSPIDIGDEFYLIQKAIKNEGKFSYLSLCDLKAYVHSYNGLSSGDSKISGENVLFEYKRQFFSRLSEQEVRYIIMRHYAVLAYAELRRRKYKLFIFHLLKSIISSPRSFIRLLYSRK